MRKFIEMNLMREVRYCFAPAPLEWSICLIAYTLHDTTSQATQISDTLKKELRLKVEPDPTITTRIVADQSTRCFERKELYLGIFG